jgi:hypothetical protein
MLVDLCFFSQKSDRCVLVTWIVQETKRFDPGARIYAITFGLLACQSARTVSAPQA